jgi:hypothetical protein
VGNGDPTEVADIRAGAFFLIDNGSMLLVEIVPFVASLGVTSVLPAGNNG